MMQQERRQSGERGAAMVELVIVLPIFLLVLFGVVELSRAWYTLQLTTAAAREGVRAAAVAPLANASAVGEARIDAVLGAGGVTAQTRSVSLGSPPAGLGGSTDSEVIANITVRFQTLFPVLLPMLQQLDIQQSAVMRHEGV